MTAALLLSIFKAIPALWNLFQGAVSLYNEEMRKADDAYSADIEKDRSALLAAIKQPGITNEERARIRRLLYNLHKL